MFEQFKILSAALALNEFTVQALAARAGVNEGTVHSVLTRRRDLFEAVGKTKTGRAGGSPLTHRLRPDAAVTLKNEVAELQAALPPAERPRPPLPDTLALNTAEEFLTHWFQRATNTTKRREILEIAALNIESTRDEVNAHFAGNTEAPEFHDLNRRLTTLSELHKTLREQLDIQEMLDEFAAVLKTNYAEAVLKAHYAEPAAAAEPVTTDPAQAMPSLYDQIKAFQERMSAFVSGSLQGQDVVVINAAASEVAAAVGSVLIAREGVHVVAVALDAQRDLDAQMRTWIKNIVQIRKFAGVIMAVDSQKIPAWMLEVALGQLTEVVPMVLDVADNVAWRNDILKRRGIYQAYCASLDPEALLGVVKRQLLDNVHAGARMAVNRRWNVTPDWSAPRGVHSTSARNTTP